MSLAMTKQEREGFLADLHVGIISITEEGRGPLTVPIWYLYEPGGEVRGRARGDQTIGKPERQQQNESEPRRLDASRDSERDSDEDREVGKVRSHEPHAAHRLVEHRAVFGRQSEGDHPNDGRGQQDQSQRTSNAGQMPASSR